MDRLVKISVIISVYNAEQTLDECIQSVIAQRERAIEVILVDDGSTDRTPDICDAWGRLDQRITVIHKENSGKADSLNHALDLCRGEYISIIDGDDWIDEDFYNYYEVCRAKSLDLLIMGYRLEPSGELVLPHYEMERVTTGLELLASNPVPHTSNDICFSWRMLFNRRFIQENTLKNEQQIRIGEDTAFNLQALSKAERTMCIPYGGYHYRTDNLGSIVRQKYKPTLEADLIRQFPIRYLEGKCSDRYYQDMSEYYIKTLLFSVMRNQYHSPEGLTWSKYRRIFQTNWFKESAKRLKKAKLGSTWKERAIFFCLLHHLNVIYYLYINIRFRMA